MKKIISIILTVVMLMAVAVPGMSAFAADKTANVYICGYGSALYDETGKQVYDVDLDLVNKLKEILDELLVDLAKGMIFGDYDDYCDKLYNLMAPGYADVKLDNNGECTDENGNFYHGTGSDPRTNLSYSKGYFTGGQYNFRYDWRLSVEYNAELLDGFISNVLKKTGATKVNLIGRCLGGNIISAYLENAPEASLKRLNKVIMYIPSTLGVDFIGALFSGEIYLDSNAIDNYVRYSMEDNNQIGNADGESDSLFMMLKTIVEFTNEVYVLGYGADVVQSILDAVKNNVLARILRDSYGTFPSFWSMVADEYVEDAIAFMFNTPELQQEYAGLIAKARSYHENVQLNAGQTMLDLIENKGIDIMVISKYNYANFPLSKDALTHSDGTASTSLTSFGATTSNFGETLSEKYIDAIAEENLKYLSKDNMIDASTCLLPEKTWFFKNLYHADFPPSVDGMINTFLNSEDMTINTYEEYPQFMKYDKTTDTFTPVTGLDEGDIIERGTVEKKLSVFMRFLTIILNFFRKLFSGELDLGGLFGGGEAA